MHFCSSPYRGVPQKNQRGSIVIATVTTGLRDESKGRRQLTRFNLAAEYGSG
jgi:hypothetical protein